ncbi:hypothetical protein BDF20DRAFT_693082 [Mycotypha africana]|uniref:uncharacterized protein n=1 Tax=Mycotypha africana TaxID=64632 RepID=UPI002301A175|nr:uncharacterized protein BDF20DRAFT_693082 [Mycotypha africana]KAI8971678.1 hypothetical protein BDF20DRAFT_693082 [Mycotypha africana]
MFSYILLMAYIAVSSYCFSVQSKIKILGTGCIEPMHKELDPAQGFQPQLSRNFAEFGYIRTINTQSASLTSDIKVKRLKSKTHQWLPYEVTGIISQFSINEASSVFTIHAFISKNNAVTMKDTTFIDSPLNLKFSTFAFDRLRYEWYTSFENGTTEGISGIVREVKILNPLKKFGNEHYKQVVIKLIPSEKKKIPNQHMIEFFNTRKASNSIMNRIDWNGPEINACRKLKTGSRFLNDYFNVIIENDIVF